MRIFVFLLLSLLMFASDRFKKTELVVYDKETKLTWQREGSSKKMTWSDAKEYCINLLLGGYDDWRLPNIDELKSIVKYDRYDPAINTDYFDIKSSWYWSSTTYVSNSSDAWGVNFNRGSDGWGSKSGHGCALCVRGQ